MERDVAAMEMVEIDGQSVGGDILQDTKSQFKNEDSVSDTNLHQLTNNSPDIIGKETVKRSCTKTHCRTALLVCVIIIVIGVIMQIPVILFATAPSSDGMINPLDVVDFKSCSVNLEIQEMISHDMVIGVFQSQMDNCNDVQASAVTALALVYGLGVMLDNRSCIDDGVSFIFNSIDVLCNNVNGSSMLTEECVEIRDSDCALEWRIVGNLLPNVSIPDCSSFDDGANLTFSTVAPPQTCPNNFDVFCDTFCLPVCGEASPYSDSTTDFYHVWAILMVVISLTGAITAFICFYLKRETMFKYPLVFVVYTGMIIPFIDVFIILPYIFGANVLLCSNDNLIASTQESTAYCEIQGLVIHGGVTVVSLVLLFHIIHFFSSVAFPFKSERLWQSTSLKRKACVIEIIVILICGLLPSIIILSVGGYQFLGFPLVCPPSSQSVPVYIFLILISVVGVISLSLLFVAFWIIHKNANRERKAKHHAHKGILFSIKHLLSSFSVTEIKLMLLISFYWVTITLLLTNVSLAVGGSDELIDDVSALVSCTAVGNETDCERITEELQEDLNRDLVMNCISQALRALIQWVNLVFVIQSSDVKAIYKKLNLKCN